MGQRNSSSGAVHEGGDVELTAFASDREGEEDSDNTVNRLLASSAGAPLVQTPVHGPRLKQWYISLINWWRRLVHACGWRFLVFLCFAQLLGKGLLMQLIMSTMLPIFRNRVNAAELEQLQMAAMLPWTIKPLMGVCADNVIIAGFRKRGWLLFGLLLGTLGGVLLLLLPGVLNDTAVLVLCFFFLNMELALYDLLSEAKCAELRRDHPGLGSDLTTLMSGLFNVGVLVGSAFVGVMADAKLFRALFAIMLGLAVAPILPTILGWLPEEREANAKAVRCSGAEELRQNWQSTLLVAAAGVGGVLVSLLTSVFRLPLVALAVALLVLAVVLIATARIFSSILLAVALYQVLGFLVQPNVGSYLDYFFTATSECLPDGPHFTFTYYTTYAGVVGNVVGVLAVILYQLLLSRLRFRTVLLLTAILKPLVSASDLFIVLRWNRAVGVSDRVAYMVGEAVLERTVDALNYIPVSALIALASPAGQEATCFAFLAGLSNFARMVSNLAGSIVINQLTDGLDCYFEMLWWAVLFCHIIMPFVGQTAAAFLIPNERQDTNVNNPNVQEQRE